MWPPSQLSDGGKISLSFVMTIWKSFVMMQWKLFHLFLHIFSHCWYTFRLLSYLCRKVHWSICQSHYPSVRWTFFKNYGAVTCHAGEAALAEPLIDEIHHLFDSNSTKCDHSPCHASESAWAVPLIDEIHHLLDSNSTKCDHSPCHEGMGCQRDISFDIRFSALWKSVSSQFIYFYLFIFLRAISPLSPF